MTLISIITPSFNQAAFLPRTLRSVLDQDHAELEYVVVDGGSSDGSLEIIKEHAGRLAWWASEPDAGLEAWVLSIGIGNSRLGVLAPAASTSPVA